MIIWINGTVCIGKSSIAKKLKEHLCPRSVNIFDADEYYDKFQQYLFSIAGDDLKKQEFASLILSNKTLPFFNTTFQKWFCREVKMKIDSVDIIIVAMTLADNAGKSILYNYLKTRTSFHHFILNANYETVLPRIKDSTRTEAEKELAIRCLKEIPMCIEKTFPNDIRIDASQAPSKVAEDIIMNLSI